ncbi:Tn3 family transposase [Streptomyces shenzhenensis]|uniref:Tn3 family transposase n=1 Tax=Streptomyces shenzhenensis TaxID=943815 RepID=UPI0035585644
MSRQLTVQEFRHKPAREVCHGKRRQIMQAYREGQEDQLRALGLVLKAAVLWTPRCPVPLSPLRGHGPPASAGTRSSTGTSPACLPASTRTFNRLGRYGFRAAVPG